MCTLLLGHVVPLSLVAVLLWAGSSRFLLLFTPMWGGWRVGAAVLVIPVRWSGSAPLTPPWVTGGGRGLLISVCWELREKTNNQQHISGGSPLTVDWARNPQEKEKLHAAFKKQNKETTKTQQHLQRNFSSLVTGSPLFLLVEGFQLLLSCCVCSLHRTVGQNGRMWTHSCMHIKVFQACWRRLIFCGYL